MAIGVVSPIVGQIQSIASVLRVMSRSTAPSSFPAALSDTLDASDVNVAQSVADVLADIGVLSDPATMALAESFSRLGVAITALTIADGRAAMARTPDVSPGAYALATSLGLSTSPGLLRGLSSAIKGLPDAETLPESLVDLLGVELGNDANRSEVASRLQKLIGQLSRETAEQTDGKSSLMDRVLVTTGQEGNAQSRVASHIEGQQVLNSIAARLDPNAPRYYAFYVKGPNGDAFPVEMRVERDERENRRRQVSVSGGAISTTVRVSPKRLGQIEVRLIGSDDGTMRCDLLAERVATTRLFARAASGLTAGLKNAGWVVRHMNVSQATEFAPLWLCGEALRTPRLRREWRA